MSEQAQAATEVEAKPVPENLEDRIYVHSADLKSNTIYFGSLSNSHADQLADLRSPQAEQIFMQACREKLRLANAGIDDQRMYNVDQNNVVVSPRVAAGNQGAIKTLWKVTFNSLFD